MFQSAGPEIGIRYIDSAQLRRFYLKTKITRLGNDCVLNINGKKVIVKKHNICNNAPSPQTEMLFTLRAVSTKILHICTYILDCFLRPVKCLEVEN
jgi:hypothetical protein